MLTPETPADSGVAKGGSSLLSTLAVALAGSLLLAGGLAFWSFRDRAAPPPQAPTADEDAEEDEALAVVNPGYVGIETCAECHATRAAEFKEGRHYLACTPP